MAYYLSTRIPAYYNNLEISDVDRIIRKAEVEKFEAATLFKELILVPLNQIEAPEHSVVILIDALDEASVDNNNGLAEILFDYADQLPKWLKIIITSRNDRSVTRYLENISYVLNLDDMKYLVNSTNDINRYVKRKLGIESEIKDKIVSESGNNFLYAQLLCDTIIKNGVCEVNDLPQNINVYYYKYLKRYLDGSDFTFGENAYPLLSIILAAYEPLRKENLYKRLHNIAGDWCKNYNVFNNLVSCFGPLLKEVDGCILPFHKSLFDWFLNEEVNPEYYIDKADGLDEMIRWGKDVLLENVPNPKDLITKHFYLYLPQYMIEAGDKSFETLYTNIDFWEKRKNVIEVNLLLKTMIEELSICPQSIKQHLFDSEEFFNILNFFNNDLFNTGRYVNLYNLGYIIPLTKGMDDNHRLFAVRSLYINELYGEIDKNIEILEEVYKDNIVEALLMNELGQTYRKLGHLEKSANYYLRSLNGAIKYKSTLDEIIYTRLNLSRIRMLQCRFLEAKAILKEAVEEFDKGLWKKSIQGVDYEFSAQQLVRAVRYVELETENFSTTPNLRICEKSLRWADEVYADITKRDRYYANHLIGKILYKIKTNKLDNIDELIKECQRNIVGKYDGIRLNCVHSLLLLCRGQVQESLQMAENQFRELKDKQLHQIQRTELAAIIGYITKTDKSGLLSEEFHPWYHQVQEIIKSIL